MKRELPPDAVRALRPTRFVDSDHPDVVARSHEIVGDAASDAEKATRLFYAVRDGIRYDPYAIALDPVDYKASAVLHQPRSWCVPKSVLLAALARAVGVPARLGFADVRNHLQSETLRERMGTDLFMFHGFTELFVGGRWLKATSAFNRELCERAGVKPLEFDGTADAVFHEFTPDGRRNMEYVRDRGTYDDLPLDAIFDVFRESYAAAVAEIEGIGEVHDELFHG